LIVFLFRAVYPDGLAGPCIIYGPFFFGISGISDLTLLCDAYGKAFFELVFVLLNSSCRFGDEALFSSSFICLYFYSI